MKQLDLTETPPHKLHRTHAPATSQAAARKVPQITRAQLVLNEIRKAANGITIKEIAALHPEIPYPSISARPAALERDGLIYYCEGDERDGARVMRLTEKALSRFAQ